MKALVKGMFAWVGWTILGYAAFVLMWGLMLAILSIPELAWRIPIPWF